ncbi:MAG: heavy metal-binding domain-containing protein [Pseudomonadota bacterium]
MTLHTTERFSNREIEEGELISVCAVEAANIIKDVREKITNTFGGQMHKYEELSEKAISRALGKLDSRAKDLGYDGVVAVRLSHPSLVDGGVEVIAYGTGFRYIE